MAEATPMRRSWLLLWQVRMPEPGAPFEGRFADGRWKMKQTYFLAMFLCHGFTRFAWGWFLSEVSWKNLCQKDAKRILPISCKQNFFLRLCAARVQSSQAWNSLWLKILLVWVEAGDACLKQRLLSLAKLPSFGLWILPIFVGPVFRDSKLNISDSTHAGGVRAWWPQNYNWRSLWDPADIFQWNMWWECVDASWLFISYYSCISSLFISYYFCVESPKTFTSSVFS